MRVVPCLADKPIFSLAPSLPTAKWPWEVHTQQSTQHTTVAHVTKVFSFLQLDKTWYG